MPAEPKTETVEERKHHAFSPSALQSYEACCCYRTRNEAGLAALRGTAQHKVAETGEDDEELSDDHAAAVADCLDFYERRRQIFTEERNRAVDAWRNSPDRMLHSEEAAVPPLLEILEIRLAVDNVPFSFIDLNPLIGAAGAPVPVHEDCTTAGYVDRCLISWDRKYCEMFDWKFGLWPVEHAENNLQGIAYALGMFRAYPTLEKITFFFYQPHIEAMSQVTWTRGDIQVHYLRILTVVMRAIQARKSGKFDSAKPMVPNCLFCGAIGVCPKVAELVCRVGKKFYAAEVPDDITPSAILPPEDAAKGMRLAQIVEVWAKAFKRQNTDRAVRGDIKPPPGFVLQSIVKREISNMKALREVALRHLTEAEYEALLTITLGDLEKTLNDKTPRGAKKTAVEGLKTELKVAGAVQEQPPITFLRAIAAKGDNEKSDSQ